MVERKLSGTIIEDATPAPRRVAQRGVKSLPPYRGTMVRSWARDGVKIQKQLAAMTEELVSLIDVAELSFDGRSLASQSLRQVELLAQRMANPTFARVGALIESKISEAVNRAQKAQLEHMSNIGVALSKAEATSIREDALRRLYTEEFPRGSGATFEKRMRSLQSQYVMQVSDLASHTTQKDVIGKIQRDLIAATDLGPANVRGGSVAKRARRLLAAEEARIANFVEVTTAARAGLSFAYWRLAPDHKWYGGQEVCEVLASEVDADVVRAMESAGIPSVQYDLEGLKLLSRWPDHPHPFCKCYVEAWTPGSGRRRRR